MSHKFFNLFICETITWGCESKIVVFRNVTFLRNCGRIKAGTKLDSISIALEITWIDKNTDLVEDTVCDLMKDMLTE